MVLSKRNPCDPIYSVTLRNQVFNMRACQVVSGQCHPSHHNSVSICGASGTSFTASSCNPPAHVLPMKNPGRKTRWCVPSDISDLLDHLPSTLELGFTVLLSLTPCGQGRDRVWTRRQRQLVLTSRGLSTAGTPCTHHPSFYLPAAQSLNGRVLLGNGCPSWLVLQKLRKGERKMPLPTGCPPSTDSAVFMADEQIPTDSFP